MINKLFNRFYTKIIIVIIIITLYSFAKIFLLNNNRLNDNEILDNTNLNNKNNIIFVNPEEAYNKIINSNYLKNFTQKDMEVRKCNNYKKCKMLYKNNLVKFSDIQKKELNRLIEICNNKLIKYKSLYDITWKLCKTTMKLEDGMPHTHADIIFISDSFFNNNNDNMKIITLIHEKIHVYQRKYKEKTNILYNSFNFNKEPKKKINLRRSNPDLDSFDYNYNGVLFYSEFKDDAKKLTDVNTKFISIQSKKNKEINEIKKIANNGYQNEHPNEIFASIISDKIFHNELNDTLSSYIT
jgi:hypothetical protein